MVATNLLLFVLVFGNAFNNRICLEQRALSLVIIFECERPLLIEYKDYIGLMPSLDLLLIRRTMMLSLASPILDNDLVVMISARHG